MQGGQLFAVFFFGGYAAFLKVNVFINNAGEIMHLVGYDQ